MTLMLHVHGRRHLVAGLLLACVSAAAVSAAAAAQGSVPAPDITGTWLATVQITGEEPARAIYSIGRDGQVTVVSDPAGSSIALGAWSAIEDGRTLITTTRLRSSEAGEPQGTMTVRESAVLSPTLDRFASTGSADIYARDGGKVLTLDVTTSATRVDAGEPQSASGPTVITARSTVREEVGPSIGQFLSLVGGTDNRGEPGSRPDGFRALVWDGVLDPQSAPNAFPPDFFNQARTPLARGAVFDSPVGTLQVSATPGNAAGVPPRFGNINVSYFNIFHPFSPEKLFAPVGSNIVDLTFFVPGSDTPAVSRGFGAIYLDVDTPHTAFEFFDIDDAWLGSFDTPLSDNGYSFLGVVYPEPVVHRVRITYGTVPLGPDDSEENDVAVMDDFLYGRPQPAE